MTILSNYKIKSIESISGYLLLNDISDLGQLYDWLRLLPYRRISEKDNLSLTIKENCGTCSSKHAFFKSVCDLNGYSEFKLCLCIYKMTEDNTPGIGSALSSSHLDYIPEAHCYIKLDEQVIDITKPHSLYDNIRNDIILEELVELEQLTKYKPKFHKAYIDQWRQEKEIDFSTDELWNIREACIHNLSLSE